MSKTHQVSTILLLAATGLAATGCAGTVEVTRTFTSEAASHAQNERFIPVAVIRGADRIALAPGARVEQDRVVLRRESLHVHHLAPGDVVEQDGEGRITAVRSSGDPPTVTRFVPGTANLPEGSDEVRGRIPDGASTIPLKRGDSIEMHGLLAPDDVVPGGGRVESARSGTLITGVVLLVLSYAPTAYVGVQSARPMDRVLALPIAGPWIDLVQRPACVPPVTPIKLPIDPCILETITRAMLVTSGSIQGLGAALTVIGLPAHARLVDDGRQGVGTRESPLRVSLVPSLGGAAIAGTF